MERNLVGRLRQERETAFAELLQCARGAVNALRSYYYGNSSPELAGEIADRLNRAITRMEEVTDMAKNNNGRYDNNKDMSTGRPCKDPQMHALKKAHGTPERQREFPPYINHDTVPDLPPVKD